MTNAIRCQELTELKGFRRRIDPRGARMLLPYVVWLGYDVVWAEELWRLNR